MQTTTPAMTINAAILAAVFGGDKGPVGEVWFATTEQSGLTYGHLLVADLTTSWDIRPSHLRGYSKNDVFWAFESNNTDKIVYFSESSPLKLSVLQINACFFQT